MTRKRFTPRSLHFEQIHCIFKQIFLPRTCRENRKKRESVCPRFPTNENVEKCSELRGGKKKKKKSHYRNGNTVLAVATFRQMKNYIRTYVHAQSLGDESGYFPGATFVCTFNLFKTLAVRFRTKPGSRKYSAATRGLNFGRAIFIENCFLNKPSIKKLN